MILKIKKHPIYRVFYDLTTQNIILSTIYNNKQVVRHIP